MYPPSLNNVIRALKILPGIGQKSATRMALYLFTHQRVGAEAIQLALQQALAQLHHCQFCRNLCETPVCDICANPERNTYQLCVVEQHSDLYLLEQATSYQGRYFVLTGYLSPLDGIGPNELGFSQLESLLDSQSITEIILATNTSVEGEATAHYIQQMASRYHIAVSRMAHGIPLGGDLEFLDASTLHHAFQTRQKYG